MELIEKEWMLLILDSNNQSSINLFNQIIDIGIHLAVLGRTQYQQKVSDHSREYCALCIKSLALNTVHSYLILVSYLLPLCIECIIVFQLIFIWSCAAAILLSHMPESYAFATLREAINDSSHFLPLSQKVYYSWCKTYSYFVERYFPVTYKIMEKCGALDPRSGLDPVFKRFFITLLRREVSEYWKFLS